MKKLEIQKTSEVDFKEIGKLISIPDVKKEPTIQTTNFKLWGSLGILDTTEAVEFGIAQFDKRKYSIKNLEQHAKTQELLLVLKGSVLMPVAPITVLNEKEYPDLTKFKAINLKENEGILFNRGVWHWSPFPFGVDTSFLLVVFKKGTAKTDVVIVNLEDEYIIE